MKNSSIIRKIYRKKDIETLNSKIMLLGSKTKFDVDTFIALRLITTLVVFILILYKFEVGYILSPIISIAYYYLFYYLLIDIPIKRRIMDLDYESLYFFEILTLTLESGRNLEKSLEVTVNNVDSEISNEFKKVLYEVRFGKSLIEALEDMKKRIPSETVNNIILSIIQTSMLGNSLVETMYNQIDFLREKQVLEIKGQINKIPNKVSIISVLFVVPLILLMVLGPFIVQLLG